MKKKLIYVGDGNPKDFCIAINGLYKKHGDIIENDVERLNSDWSLEEIAELKSEKNKKIN